MIQVTRAAWNGPTPGYGDASSHRTVIGGGSDPILIVDGLATPIPEPCNNVWVSDGGQFAWQGHESGLIYLGHQSTGKQGYGQWSAAFVGEELRIFTDVETYQQTAGGWRYVSDDMQVVSYGATYSGPPLWEWTQRGDVRIGQGPENEDGICCVLPDGIVRQILPGNWRNIRVRRDGDELLIVAVNYSTHDTGVWQVSRAELASLPVLSHSAPQPPPDPQPEPVPVPDTPGSSKDRPIQTSPLDVPYLTAAVRASWRGWYGTEMPPDEVTQWVGYASRPDQYSDGLWRIGYNAYWEYRMGPEGKDSAPVQLADQPPRFVPEVGTPVPNPGTPPPQDADLSKRLLVLEGTVQLLRGFVGQLESELHVSDNYAEQLRARIEVLENRPAPKYRVSGSTSRTFGHSHSINVTLEPQK